MGGSIVPPGQVGRGSEERGRRPLQGRAGEVSVRSVMSAWHSCNLAWPCTTKSTRQGAPCNMHGTGTGGMAPMTITCTCVTWRVLWRWPTGPTPLHFACSGGGGDVPLYGTQIPTMETPSYQRGRTQQDVAGPFCTGGLRTPHRHKCRWGWGWGDRHWPSK